MSDITDNNLVPPSFRANQIEEYSNRQTHIRRKKDLSDWFTECSNRFHSHDDTLLRYKQAKNFLNFYFLAINPNK